MNSIPKQAILLIIFSIVAMFCQDQLAHVLRFLLHIHNEIESWTTVFFAGSEIGKVIQGIIALVLFPLVIGGVVGLGFWLVKHVSMPHIMSVVWVTWLIMLVTILAQAA
jgi:hypothetical protein